MRLKLKTRPYAVESGVILLACDVAPRDAVLRSSLVDVDVAAIQHAFRTVTAESLADYARSVDDVLFRRGYIVRFDGSSYHSHCSRTVCTIFRFTLMDFRQKMFPYKLLCVVSNRASARD